MEDGERILPGNICAGYNRKVELKNGECTGKKQSIYQLKERNKMCKWLTCWYWICQSILESNATPLVPFPIKYRTLCIVFSNIIYYPNKYAKKFLTRSGCSLAISHS